MSQKLQVLLLIAIFTVVKSQTNYCAMPSCWGGTHTMCRFPSANPVSKCKNLTTSYLTTQEKRTILDIHNRLRRKVASGSETRGYPGPQPASTNMPDLIWDNELEMIAQRWSNQCDYKHDYCRDVARFRVGQNIALYPSSDKVVETIMTDFYNEVTSFNKAEVSRFLGANLQDVGHYTQLVWGKTTKIGCGATRFVAFNNVLYFYLVCNYGPAGNVFHEPVYQTR